MDFQCSGDPPNQLVAINLATGDRTTLATNIGGSAGGGVNDVFVSITRTAVSAASTRTGWVFSGIRIRVGIFNFFHPIPRGRSALFRSEFQWTCIRSGRETGATDHGAGSYTSSRGNLGPKPVRIAGDTPLRAGPGRLSHWWIQSSLSRPHDGLLDIRP